MTFRGSHWIVVSALGAWAGVMAARLLFPGAALAKNPTGVFGWHLVGFAASVGVVLAVAQWFYLRATLKVQRPSLLMLWVPLTAVCVVAAILPLYWVDAEALLFLNLEAARLLPGLIALGVAQWLVLAFAGSGISHVWIVYSLAGAFLGALFAIPVVFLIYLIVSLLPFGDALLSVLPPFASLWAAVTMVWVAAAQAAYSPAKAS